MKNITKIVRWFINQTAVNTQNAEEKIFADALTLFDDGWKLDELREEMQTKENVAFAAGFRGLSKSTCLQYLRSSAKAIREGLDYYGEEVSYPANVIENATGARSGVGGGNNGKKVTADTDLAALDRIEKRIREGRYKTKKDAVAIARKIASISALAELAE